MACPCCGGGIIPCADCSVVIREAGTGQTVINSEFVECAGPGYNYSSTVADTSSPCDDFAAAFGPCTFITGVPEEYADCTCMTLEARCTTSDYDLGTDENGNCCVAYSEQSTLINYVYVFDNSGCPDPPGDVRGTWRLILTTTTETPSCTVFSLGANCTAACPDYRDCTPLDPCETTYDGCECNEFP